ncbi:hypothetical protein GCM10010924_61040 [Rhizobium wenxiniae]|uniref:hypothetical protein n=1 Tax=Rhizobium wenxiniae TaxID=1737357 RepID=UPI0019ABA99A|nr:hypothetical protein [Rhizobium wenxiniae]GGG23311.1 hypothetical protein GCM10010924_61040 [Rhizobium wenxiniae]
MAKIFMKKFESRSWPSDGLIEQAILNEDSKLPLETETYGDYGVQELPFPAGSNGRELQTFKALNAAV